MGAVIEGWVGRSSQWTRCPGRGADGVHAGLPHHPRAARGVVGVHGPDRQLPRHQARRHRRAALAQRWSKYMAVTFAVGAVTGTVLTFEFGLLWPRVHGPVGRGVRRPVRLRGALLLHRGDLHRDLHLRLAPPQPWAHFWTGVPVVLTGILGSVSVVAANAWMNPPRGSRSTDRRGGRRRPVGGDLQRRDAADGRHMVVAAYVVGGFLVASVYAVGHAARPAGPLPPPRFLIPFRVRRDRHPDPDGRRRLAGPLGLQQPAGQVRRHRAGARDRERRPRDAARPAQLGRRGHRRDPDPRLASWLSDPATERARWSRASTPCPADERPTISQVNTVHLAWDVMVGLGTLLFLLSAWYWLCWIFRRTCPGASCSCASPRVPASPPSSAWRPAGWSARSAASRGSSTT